MRGDDDTEPGHRRLPWVGAGTLPGNAPEGDRVTPGVPYGGSGMQRGEREEGASRCRPAPSDRVAQRRVPAYFTAPAITPDTNCRWNAKNTTSGITIEMKAPGAR